jgi:3-isopropylmalate dehydrogenase
VAGGFDLLVVRELTGGLYFGQPKETTKTARGERAVDTMVYETHEIERVAEVAFRAASFRKKRVTLADKANVLETSLLWRKVVRGVAARHPTITLDFIYADNAAMQLVRDPGRFDVLLCENLFGDMLSDQAAAVAGSLGMLPSASLGEGSFGLYEPAGGSAPDIAGKGVANPIAQILSLALLCEMSLGQPEAAESIRQAVAGAIREGWRTADLALAGEKKVGTQEIAKEIARRVALGRGKG